MLAFNKYFEVKVIRGNFFGREKDIILFENLT